MLHGGDNDILWLQRDFRIYAVNVFDTAKASRVSLPENASICTLSCVTQYDICAARSIPCSPRQESRHSHLQHDAGAREERVVAVELADGALRRVPGQTAPARRLETAVRDPSKEAA